MSLETYPCFICGGEASRWGRGKPCLNCSAAHDLVAAAAHRAVRRAVREGILPPYAQQYCVDCGGFAQCYDHRSHLKPLDVEPVCRSCNSKRGRSIELRPEIYGRMPSQAAA